MCERASLGDMGSMLSVYACLILILVSGLDSLIHLTSKPIKKTQVRMRTNFVIHSLTISHRNFLKQKKQFIFLLLLGTQDVVYNHKRKTIKQTLNVLLFTLINPSAAVSFSFETVM